MTWNMQGGPSRLMSMKSRVALSATILVALCACGSPTADEVTRAPRPPASSPSASQEDTSGLYEANATVLDDGDSGPMLCLGGILGSLPPQCGDVPVAGWDWAAVEGEETAAGVTWGGSYHVVGRFDGTTFELTRTPRPPAAHLEPDDDFSSEPACEEPPGGWISEGEGVDQEAAGNLLAPLERVPEYAAGWITQLEPPGEYEDTGAVILNAAFTDNVVEHERRLRQQWPGSLCVTLYEHTLDELRRIQREAGELAQEMGSQNLYSDVDVTRNLVELHVVHLPDDTRAQLERRFGRDALRLSAALVPVEE